MFVVSRTADHLEALAAEIRAAGGRCLWHAADLRRRGRGRGGVRGRSRRERRAAGRGLQRRRDLRAPVRGRAAPRGDPRGLGDRPRGPTRPRSSWWRGRRSAGCSPRSRTRAGTPGRVLLMSSTLATHPAPAFFATHAYAASKGAIDGARPVAGRVLRAPRDPGQRDRPVADRDPDEPAGPGGPGDPRLSRREAAARRRADRGRRGDGDGPPPALARRRRWSPARWWRWTAGGASASRDADRQPRIGRRTRVVGRPSRACVTSGGSMRRVRPVALVLSASSACVMVLLAPVGVLAAGPVTVTGSGGARRGAGDGCHGAGHGDRRRPGRVHDHR